MSHLYNKKHVQAYVFAFTILGALYGFWIGKRAEVSGILEGAFVFVTFVALANIAVWIIEKKRLPPNSAKKNDD